MSAEQHAPSASEYIVHHLTHWRNKPQTDIVDFTVFNIDSLFFFAKVGNEIAGYLKLNAGAAQTELTDHETVEIERIYVQNAYQGLKIGKALFEKADREPAERADHQADDN